MEYTVTLAGVLPRYQFAVSKYVEESLDEVFADVFHEFFENKFTSFQVTDFFASKVQSNSEGHVVRIFNQTTCKDEGMFVIHLS